MLFHPAVFAALASAVLFATYQLMTRSLSEADTPWTTLFYTAGGGAFASLFLAVVYWQTPTAADLITFAILGTLGILAHTCLVLAFTWAPAGLVVNFAYSELIFATLFGWLFFSHLPDSISIAGMAIIVFSGGFILWRERLHQAATTASNTPASNNTASNNTASNN